MTEHQLTQAEIASGIFKIAETCPVKGQLIRDFALVPPKEQRLACPLPGRSNLVLVFAGGDSQSLQLTRIANSYRKVREEQTEVLAVVQCSNEKAARVKDEARAKFPVLVYRDGRIHRLMVHKIGEVKLKWQCTSQIALAKCLAFFVSQKIKRCPESKRFSDGWRLGTASVRNAVRQSGLSDRSFAIERGKGLSNDQAEARL